MIKKVELRTVIPEEYHNRVSEPMLGVPVVSDTWKNAKAKEEDGNVIISTPDKSAIITISSTEEGWNLKEEIYWWDKEAHVIRGNITEYGPEGIISITDT